MADQASGSAEALTGLKGLPATVVKLGFAGMVLLMLSWKIMYEDPKERRAAREHGERAVIRLSESIDRQTATIIDMQGITHENQRKLLSAQNKTNKASNPPW